MPESGLDIGECDVIRRRKYFTVEFFAMRSRTLISDAVLMRSVGVHGEMSAVVVDRKSRTLKGWALP